jgi:glycosyltransferase involved in cell wall biosynthesis
VPPGPLPSMSIVMPTYGRRALLPRVLAPLLAEPHAAEVIVVVDGARDGSFEYLEALALEHPPLRPILISNRGASAARDAGAEAATSEVVLFLDDDVVAGPSLVQGHARHHAGTAGAVVLGWIPVAATAISSPRYTVDLYSEWYEQQVAEYGRWPERILHNLWAGNLSIRRADWSRVRFASPSFTYDYNADRDFGLRCLRAGLTGVFDRALRAEHFYVRKLNAFLRDARSAGAGRAQLHRLHGDLLGPLADDIFQDGLPAGAQAALRLARRPRAFATLDMAGRAALPICGALHQPRWERRFALLLTRAHQQSAALTAPSPPRPTSTAAAWGTRIPADRSSPRSTS